jgi:putative transposase
MDTLEPKDHSEAIALFRAEIIGALARREWEHGELAEEVRALSRVRYRPPHGEHTRTYSVPTLERWYYALRTGGLAALRPQPRSDKGRAQQLTAEQRQLILDIRREHPSTSAALILRTLVTDGRLAADAISTATLNRLFDEHGLDRRAARDGQGARTRLRWQAERPNALWQGDVCHGPALVIGGESRPLRIHALLDDASRYVVALEAHHQERELEMLGLLSRALRRHGKPDVLYLDNGATYRGDILRVACGRLSISLLHPRPYDAPARGKMERFWRTLREALLDHLGPMATLHDVNVRLWAFLDEHYHRAPHGGLMGKAPGAVYAQRPAEADALDETALREALTVRQPRRVRRDTTVSVRGQDWELEQGFLAGRKVTVGYCLVEPTEAPWVEHEGKRYDLHLVDPIANAKRKRPPRRAAPASSDQPQPEFDPAGALLDQAVGRSSPKAGQ